MKDLGEPYKLPSAIDEAIGHHVLSAEETSSSRRDHLANFEWLRLVQDTIWAKYSETTLAEREKVWLSVTNVLAATPMTGLDRYGYSGNWIFAFEEEREGTKVQVEACIGAYVTSPHPQQSRPPHEEAHRRILEYSMHQIRRQNPIKRRELPTVVAGENADKWRNRHISAQELRARLRDFVLERAVLLQAGVTVKALGYGTEDEQVLQATISADEHDPNKRDYHFDHNQVSLIWDEFMWDKTPQSVTMPWAARMLEQRLSIDSPQHETFKQIVELMHRGQPVVSPLHEAK